MTKFEVTDAMVEAGEKACSLEINQARISHSNSMRAAITAAIEASGLVEENVRLQDHCRKLHVENLELHKALREGAFENYAPMIASYVSDGKLAEKVEDQRKEIKTLRQSLADIANGTNSWFNHAEEALLNARSRVRSEAKKALYKDTTMNTDKRRKQMTEPEYITNPDGTVGKTVLVSDRTIVDCTFPLSNGLGIDIQYVSDVVPTKLAEALNALISLADAVCDYADQHCRAFPIATFPRERWFEAWNKETNSWQSIYLRQDTGMGVPAPCFTHWREPFPPPSNPPLPEVFVELGAALEKIKSTTEGK